MFDDICMACGKFLDQGRVYCSEDCESADRIYSSPSLSSTTTSSTTSPYILTSVGPLADVPALHLSSMGESSSSASSDVTSVFEYDDDDNEYDTKSTHNTKAEYHLPPLDTHDDTVRVPRPPLSFTRRPSHADNRSLVPVLHRHFSDTATTTTHVKPRQLAAKHPSAPDVPRHRHSQSLMRAATPKPAQYTDTKRTRASLPAYFSLLELAPHGPRPKAPDVDSATPTASRRHGVYEPTRSRSVREATPESRVSWGTSRVAVPGSREREASRERSRLRGDGERDAEGRGRSRVVTPRVS